MIISSLLSSLKIQLTSKRVKQTLVLYLSLVISLALGIAVSVINTRLLGADAFGEFKFLQTIWTLGVTCVTFGLFATGGNLLAKCKSSETERHLIGSLLVIAIAIALVFTLFMIAASIPIGRLYGQELAEKIRLYSGLVFVFPLQVYLQEVLRGTNAIANLSLLNVLPPIFYIAAVMAIKQYFDFSLNIALLAYLLSIAVSVAVLTFLSKPKFNQLKSNVSEVLLTNKIVGLNLYLAGLIVTATTQLSQFSLAYFFDTRSVGIFSLAVTITMPLTMIPNAVATTFFKQFASLNKIPQKVIFATIFISLVTLIIFLFIVKSVILFLYSDQFIDVVPLAYLCAVGAMIHGMGDVCNRFLLAHGRTQILRNNAIVLGVSSVIGYIALVSQMGLMGAALTKTLVDIIYLMSMIYYYKYLSIELKSNV